MMAWAVALVLVDWAEAREPDATNKNGIDNPIGMGWIWCLLESDL
jgi:hypothetical protein